MQKLFNTTAVTAADAHVHHRIRPIDPEAPELEVNVRPRGAILSIPIFRDGAASP